MKHKDALGYEDWEFAPIDFYMMAIMFCRTLEQNLKNEFEKYLKELEQQVGWITTRIKPPVLILGSFQGIETGIRQLIRTKPLETMLVNGIKIPTLPEMLRIKGFLVVKRNTTRDFLDFTAIADKLQGGNIKKYDEVIGALSQLDVLYPQANTELVTRQLAKQLIEPRPYDLERLEKTVLKKYKGLRQPYNEWAYIEKRCSEIAAAMIESCLLLEVSSETPSYPK